jgi:competence protein ComEA
MFKKLAFLLFISFFYSVAFAADKININTASVEQLELLNGIGVKTATAIVEYREKIGSFSDVNELLAVKGIGEKKLAKIVDDITTEKMEESM